jgi:CHAD domain-containing protein
VSPKMPPGSCRPLACEFLEHGHKLFTSLHGFRLLTKRFRYTLELFRCCYGPGLERRIEALHTLQQRLGEINDCATTREILLGRDDLRFAERDRLVRRLEETGDDQARHVAAPLAGRFRAATARHWWTDY